MRNLYFLAGRGMGLLAALMILVSLNGCNKMLAQYSVGQAESRRDEALGHDAERLTPEMLQDVNTQITTAAGQLERQQYAEARQSASAAADRARELLTQTIQARATDLREQASIWIDRGRRNEAQRIDAQRFVDIQALYATGEEQIANQRFEQAIETLARTVADMQALLANLRYEAEQGLQEVRELREGLITEGTPEHAPEFMEEIAGQISDIERFINVEYDYRSAIATRDAARQTHQRGVTETRRVRSDQSISEIELLLETALSLDAEIFAQQTLNVVSRDLENLSLQYMQGNYETVLGQAPQVNQAAQDLIQETRVNAARQQLAAVERAIDRLTSDRAREYLPGYVEQVDQLAADARAQLEAEEYVESRAISERGLLMVRNIEQEFDALAQRRINAAAEELGAAEGVFRTMEQIFDQPIPGDWTGADAALEGAKQALKEELRGRLTQSQESLNLATRRREGMDFDMAIEIAEQVQRDATHVIGQTYRVVAHNAILEISNELTHYERQGGRQYAAQELDRTHAMLWESRSWWPMRNSVRRSAARPTARPNSRFWHRSSSGWRWIGSNALLPRLTRPGLIGRNIMTPSVLTKRVSCSVRRARRWGTLACRLRLSRRSVPRRWLRKPFRPPCASGRWTCRGTARSSSIAPTVPVRCAMHPTSCRPPVSYG